MANRLQDVDCGFNLIIDRRRDRWTSVKTVLMKVSSYFPALIHVVYVLRPAGFFQKAISEVSTKFFKEEFRFRLVVCSSLEELNEFVPEHQLTSDLGGSLAYSHHEWIQQMIVRTCYFTNLRPVIYNSLYSRAWKSSPVLPNKFLRIWIDSYAQYTRRSFPIPWMQPEVSWTPKESSTTS